MSFDLGAVARAVALHGRVARVVVAAVKGSAPREVGASMLVWDGGQSGTIGGGALEYEAARMALDRAGASLHALGPDLGQCCGGAVTLWTDVFDAETIASVAEQTVFARGPGARPLAVQRVIDRARGRGAPPVAQMIQGWMVEPLWQPQNDLWIWGAGHVGRALVDVMAPLPDWQMTWIDTDATRFPNEIAAGITPLWGQMPPAFAPRAPIGAHHVIATYSHEVDLQLCHALLCHGFASAGLIGSATKWARFRKRLGALGHGPEATGHIRCPIGDKTLGRAPAAIAIGVAAALLLNARKDHDAWMIPSSASQG